MDFTTASTAVNASASAVAATTCNATAVSTKTPDVETEAPATRIQPLKPISSTTTTNGVLKRHHPYNNHHHHNHALTNLPAAVTYKDCLKNHAATLGGYAVDGCGEFMPSPSSTLTDPTSLKCAACGCHRNFHRREPDDPSATTLQVLEFQPHHRHHPPPPHLPRVQSPDSQSPPPISSSYYPSAPHMLLALSAGLAGHPDNSSGPAINATPTAALHPSNLTPSPNGRKRFRTKFSQGQKEKMYRFAERVGWKMQKKDEDLVAQFCGEIGVERGVLKVWMHNNKNTLGRRDCNNNNNNNSGGSRDDGLDNADHDILGSTAAHHQHHNSGGGDDDDDVDHHNHEQEHHLNVDGGTAPFGANGSSSSS